MKKIFFVCLINIIIWIVVGIGNLFFVDNISKLSYFLIWISMMSYQTLFVFDKYVDMRIEEWENR